ncbi:MAG TPA: S53 family peptidase [Streptosporangiaceae bacterium]|nr:S53 family peptidase [Streptosporangiaceae bacterium]
MRLIVFPRWAGVLAAAAGLMVAGMATVPAVAATSHATASGPSATPRFVSALHAVRLPSGFARVCPTPTVPGVMQCSSVVRSAVSAQPANRPASSALSPGQLRSAYGLGKATQVANKGTIAIVDAYNDWHATADLAKYRSYYGIQACTTATRCLRVVNQKGTTSWLPKGNADWAEEESLDLDMVSAICPKCKILLVEANNPKISNLSTAEDTAARLGAKFISNSWGSGAEFSTETSYDHYFNHLGVAITASSGDYGYGTQWPAVSPSVTSVGGTTLWMKGRTRTEEKAWSQGTGDGTGSGCSALEPQQIWQAPFGSGCANRIDNDVAADADPRTGPAVYDSYPPANQGLPKGWQQLGGTSVASPIIAAVYALANPGGAAAKGSLPTRFPYQASSGLRDITIGANGSCGTYLCTAATGYDGPTGLGVPSGVNAFK